MDRPLPDGKFTCHRSFIGGVIRLDNPHPTSKERSQLLGLTEYLTEKLDKQMMPNDRVSRVAEIDGETFVGSMPFSNGVMGGKPDHRKHASAIESDGVITVWWFDTNGHPQNTSSEYGTVEEASKAIRDKLWAME